MKKIQSIKGLVTLRDEIKKQKSSNEIQIVISNGTCGQARGSEKIVQAFRKEIERQKIQDKVEIRATGCHGFCEVEPNIIIYPKGIFYQRLKPQNVKAIISETILKKKIIEDFLYIDPNTNKKFIYEKEIPFYIKQQRIVSGNNIYVDPTNINDYLAIGGYEALIKVLSEKTPDQVINIIKN